MPNASHDLTGLGRALRSKSWARVSELVVVFVAGFAVILSASLFGDGPVAHIGGIWAANVVMLVLTYWGLRRRGQSWEHFGLSLRLGSRRSVTRGVLLSFPVFVAAIGAFVVGAIMMANIVGMPAGADMSQYAYLRGNLKHTVLALLSVYMVSAFAEEVIYRGFLITRITELGADSRTARWLAVVVSSIVFGLVHSDWGLAGMVQASLMGLALGLSYVFVRRNLWVMILAHGYMDTILVLQMYFVKA